MRFPPRRCRWHPRRCRRHVRLLVALLLAVLPAPGPAADQRSTEAAVLEELFGSVDPERIRRHVDFLASDDLEGREAGTRGADHAAEYIAEKFRQYGLLPPPAESGKSSFLQSFRFGLLAKRQAANVVGFLEGRDPDRKQEVVLVGAHYDHVGRGRPGGSTGRIGRGKREDDIYNGADDNASGTAALLELARLFASSPIRSRRSLVFVAFSAEEKGLLGSRHYVRNPAVALSQTVAMINLDMIGRNAPGKLYAWGETTSVELKKLFRAAAKVTDLEIRNSPGGMFAASDHFPFYARRIPALFLTSGLHQDYHRVSDHAEKVAPEKVAGTCRLTLLVLHGLANRPSRPRFRPDPLAELALAWSRPRLGITGKPLGAKSRKSLGIEQAGAIGIETVLEDSSAEKAGLEPGDVLLSLDGRALDPRDPLGDLRRRLSRIPKKHEVKLEILRSGERRELVAKL